MYWKTTVSKNISLTVLGSQKLNTGSPMGAFCFSQVPFTIILHILCLLGPESQLLYLMHHFLFLLKILLQLLEWDQFSTGASIAE